MTTKRMRTGMDSNIFKDLILLLKDAMGSFK